jgi:histidinol-phosphatase (PHP family)
LAPDKISLVDYHVHPYYSLDAEGTVDEYCEKALSLGLSEIGFAPHLELDPLRKKLDDKVRVGERIVPMRSDWLSVFVDDVERAREKYPLELKIGVEVGYDETTAIELEDLLKSYPFDFCLGAIHCLEHVAITDRREYELYYRNRNAEEVLTSYFSEIEKTVRSGLFDSIAHLDIYKKYGVRCYGDLLGQLEEKFLTDALTLLAEHDIALEVNMSGLRTIGSPYPSVGILEKARSVGVRTVTLGSDCHKVEHLGYGIEEGRRLVESMGFILHGFALRKPYRIDDAGD